METARQEVEHPVKARMRRDGVDIGTLVELNLSSSTDLNLASTVPTYCLGVPGLGKVPKDGTPRVCAGYVAEIKDYYVSLLPVWDKQHQKHPDLGHVGGVNVSFHVIESYRKI